MGCFLHPFSHLFNCSGGKRLNYPLFRRILRPGMYKSKYLNTTVSSKCKILYISTKKLICNLKARTDFVMN